MNFVESLRRKFTIWAESYGQSADADATETNGGFSVVENTVDEMSLNE